MSPLLNFFRQFLCPKCDFSYYIARIEQLSKALANSTQPIVIPWSDKIIKPRHIIPGVVTADIRYVTYSLDEWKEMLTKIQVGEEMEYRKSVFDCDDFALVYASCIATSAYYSGLDYQPAFCIMWSKGHAYNGFITDTNEVYIYEPQQDRVIGKYGEDNGENYATEKVWLMG